MTRAASPDALVRYYSSRLAAHGDTAEGAGWPNEADRLTRFEVMADIAGRALHDARVLDVACGTGTFLTYLLGTERAPADYVGIDICPDAIARARAKHPGVHFEVRDILADAHPVLEVPADFVFVNGLFTVRDSVARDMMWDFMAAMLARLWPATVRGIAFNVMSDVVNWRREDLFHIPMDCLARHLFGFAGRRIVFRNDYDLFEYTAYVFRAPISHRVWVPEA